MTASIPAALHAEAKTIDTFQDFAVEFYQKKTTTKESASEEARIIKNELFPRWRDRKASEITRADVKALLRPIAARAKKCAAALSGWQPLGFTFHRHDLRRTAGTGMAEDGIPTETIARVLNHVDRNPRATRTYDRFSHDPEKRVALEA